MDEYTTNYLEAVGEEAERFREAAMILAEQVGVSGHTGRNHVHCGHTDKRS